MSDIALILKDNCFDINVKDGDLEADGGLQTAVSISLFTDRRVNDEQLPDLAESKRGWWGDMFPEIDQDKIGSRLWTLEREKRTTQTLRRFEDFCEEALEWLLDDGVASTISVVASYNSDGQLEAELIITKPDGNQSRFQTNWDQQELKGA